MSLKDTDDTDQCDRSVTESCVLRYGDVETGTQGCNVGLDVVHYCYH